MSYATALHATLAEHDNQTIIKNRQFSTITSETTGEKMQRSYIYSNVHLHKLQIYFVAASVVDYFLMYYTHSEITVICLEKL